MNEIDKNTNEYYTKIGKLGLKKYEGNCPTKQILKFLKKNILKKKDKILDIGCGYGRILLKLDKEKYNIFGIDQNENYINIINKNKNLSKIGDMKNIKLPDHSYQTIINIWGCFECIQNEEDQIKTLNEGYRLLKEKGTYFLDLKYRTPKEIKTYLKNKKYGSVIKEFFNMKVNFFFYTKPYLKTIIKKSKFNIFEIKRYKIKNVERMYLKLTK